MGSQNNEDVRVQTCYPGFAYNFNPVEQTCEVQLAIEHIFVGMDEPYKLIPPQRLQKVQVQFPQGGGFVLTHPVPDGTPVLVHFATRGISHFKNDGASTAGFVNGSPAPQFSQMYSFDNATCTVGNQPIVSAVKDFNNEGMELRNNDRSQRITLNPDKSLSIISGESVIHLDKDGNMTTTAKNYTAKAYSFTFDGKASFTDTVDVSGELTVKGKAVSTHTHKNPEGGDVGPME